MHFLLFYKFVYFLLQKWQHNYHKHYNILNKCLPLEAKLGSTWNQDDLAIQFPSIFCLFWTYVLLNIFVIKCSKLTVVYSLCKGIAAMKHQIFGKIFKMNIGSLLGRHQPKDRPSSRIFGLFKTARPASICRRDQIDTFTSRKWACIILVETAD